MACWVTAQHPCFLHIRQHWVLLSMLNPYPCHSPGHCVAAVLLHCRLAQILTLSGLAGLTLMLALYFAPGDGVLEGSSPSGCTYMSWYRWGSYHYHNLQPDRLQTILVSLLPLMINVTRAELRMACGSLAVNSLPNR